MSVRNINANEEVNEQTIINRIRADGGPDETSSLFDAVSLHSMLALASSELPQA